MTKLLSLSGYCGILLLSICIVVALSSTSLTQQKEAKVGSSDGRFIIIFSPHSRSDTFLIDTHTGKVWELVKYTNVESEPSVWQFMERLDDKRKLMQWSDEAPLKSPDAGTLMKKR